MKPRWDNISLTIGGAILLVLGSLILGGVSFIELSNLIFPSGADRSLIELLCVVGILITAALAAVVIIRKR